MNTYILVTLENSYIATDLISRSIAVKELITLSAKNASTVGEYYDYSGFCKRHGMECISLDSYGMSEDKEKLKNIDIDLLLVLGWQRLIPEWFINSCAIGAIGVHGSPWGIVEGRGRSPQNWAIIADADYFLVSIFWIENNVDSGDVIDTGRFAYTVQDDIETSYMKCGILVSRMIIDFVRNGCRKKSFRQAGTPLYLPQRKREDGEIDWNRNGERICSFVRALTHPYPGAYSKIGGRDHHMEVQIS